VGCTHPTKRLFVDTATGRTMCAKCGSTPDIRSPANKRRRTAAAPAKSSSRPAVTYDSDSLSEEEEEEVEDEVDGLDGGEVDPDAETEVEEEDAFSEDEVTGTPSTPSQTVIKRAAPVKKLILPTTLIANGRAQMQAPKMEGDVGPPIKKTPRFSAARGIKVIDEEGRESWDFSLKTQRELEAGNSGGGETVKKNYRGRQAGAKMFLGSDMFAWREFKDVSDPATGNFSTYENFMIGRDYTDARGMHRTYSINMPRKVLESFLSAGRQLMIESDHDALANSGVSKEQTLPHQRYQGEQQPLSRQQRQQETMV